MNILIRADSSSTIGTGHIMRDLVLAQKYSKKGETDLSDDSYMIILLYFLVMMYQIKKFLSKN